MYLFYTPNVSGSFYTLDQQESAHCIRVLRLIENDIVFITDGTGQLYKSKIVHANPKKCELEIIETTKDYNKIPYELHMAIAPTKNIDRFEWFLEKATEIGISEITPLICDRSERRIIKPDRLIKVISSAMKQSLKAYLPKLNEQQNIGDFLQKAETGLKFLANCEETPANHLFKHCRTSGRITILIGPEGDFTPAEMETAFNSGYTSVSLGTSRLRTETAGIVACHSVSLHH